MPSLFYRIAAKIFAHGEYLGRSTVVALERTERCCSRDLMVGSGREFVSQLDRQLGG